MTNKLHLRTRIGFWSALVVIGSVLICGIAATCFVRHEEIVELDGDLQLQASMYLQEWRASDPATFDWKRSADSAAKWSPANDGDQLLEVTGPNGESLYRAPQFKGQPLPWLKTGLNTRKLLDQPLRVGVFRESGLTLVLAADESPINLLVRKLAGAFALTLPIGLGIVALGSRWIAGKAMEPIREITESAEGITIRDLSQRVPVPGSKDEIDRLAIVLNDTFDRLEQSFHQATRFTADASHELKTPLTVLRTSIEALRRSPTLAPLDQESVEQLLEQTKRLSTITGDLLLLSRADAGKLVLDLQASDLSELVALCAEDAGIIAAASDITIRTELPAAAPVALDRLRASQIVMNLLDNALKYNHPGGTIDLRLGWKDQHWHLAVSNTGPGIPEDALPNLFTRFFRASHSSSTPGHGLGLSLSRELARAHGGDLIHIPTGSRGLTRFLASFPATTGT